MFKEENEETTELECLTLCGVGVKIQSDPDFVKFVSRRISREQVFEQGTMFNIKILGHPVQFEVYQLEPKCGVFTDNTELIILREKPIPAGLENKIWEFATHLSENADNLETEAISRYQGDWNYTDQDRYGMLTEAKAIRAVVRGLHMILSEFIEKGDNDEM